MTSKKRLVIYSLTFPLIFMEVLNMKLKCPNKKCNYEWDYQGEHEFYATCPRCLAKVKITQTNSNRKENGF